LFHNNRSEVVSEKTSIKIVLNWYEIKGNGLVGEEVIQNMSEDDILKLFEAPFWNKLYHCWSVETPHIKTLQKNVQHEINTKEFSYFVEIFNLT